MGSTILILDDSESIHMQLTNYVRKLDPDALILSAHGLAGAREALARRRPDVVFIDLLLVSESGLDFLWDVGRSVPGARVVTMSGLPPEDSLVAAARRMGVGLHLEKPLRFDAVAAALGEDEALA